MTQSVAMNVTYKDGQFRVFSMPSLPSPTPPLQLVNQLIVEAEKLWDVPAGSIKSKRRTKEYCLPRFAVIYAARRMSKPTRSYPEIGRMMGRRDHTSIIHGGRRALEIRRTDPEFASMLACLILTVRRARRVAR